MPTNEERREVARKLRDLCGRDYGEAGVPIDDIERTLGVEPILPCAYDPNDVDALADLIEPDPEQTNDPRAELGNYRSLRCPKCGGEVTIVYDDYDWWDATCDGCGYDFSFDPGKYIDFGAVQTDWTHQYAEEAANAD